jgi:IrrE N-terminal-like domain
VERRKIIDVRSPTRWATDLTRVLNAVLGADHFPIKISEVAKELSVQMFPDDPIIGVGGRTDIDGFEGCLWPAEDKKGWGIVFNENVKSKGRINFTLAHEFGHYLLHRSQLPNGMQCGEQDLTDWQLDYKAIENEANNFAAHFLMPLDDYRRQVPENANVTLDVLGGCADRYEVSLTAATLRWLAYTEKRAVLVASRDGFMLWAKPSEAALKSGAYFKTVGITRPIPRTSAAAQRSAASEQNVEARHAAGVWFPEPVHELTLFSDRYDMAYSLLLLEDGGSSWPKREATDDDADEYAAQMQRLKLMGGQ